ncbi:RNA polymerase sigma factor [Ktedonospora formicarum]|uniref:RNA polymerase sigma factor n=1 Tax=Ktedonospora formicarum TaxID=2778364 RepID=A0A8J3I835_9CHLR|nr:sigma-70 family RNA polymerase sigma factor [Ktedonospora formicarum]GHO48908.1 RNA polymerase sigma factor [Ktedonospora formicarum]
MKNNIRSSQSAQVSLGSPTSLWAQDDVSLIKASQHRDQEAFALLVRKYQRPIFTLAFYILQDAEEASILTQETFLAAWKALPLLPRDAPFSLWLLRLTYQQCIQQQKQQTPGQGWQSKWHATYRQERRSQQTTIEREDLSMLPTISRVVLILRYLQALTYEEIALVLSLPIRTVKAHLFRARTFLNEQGQSRQQR